MKRTAEFPAMAVPIQQPPAIPATHTAVPAARAPVPGDEVPGPLQSGVFTLVPTGIIAAVLQALDATFICVGCYGAQSADHYFELRSLSVWTPQLRAAWPTVDRVLFARTEHLLGVLERIGSPARHVRGQLLDPTEERLAQMTLS